MESSEIKRIVESLLFITDRPLPLVVIKDTLGDSLCDTDCEQLVKEIAEEYAQRNSPMELRFIAGGWQFATKKEFSPWIRRLYREKATLKLSPSALETLAIIAYKQPITRAEIEEIRGVETSGVIETILERKLVKIVGRKETIGRPLLYGTTQEFLRHFGLSHLSEMPSVEELVAPDDAVIAEKIQEAEDTQPELGLAAEAEAAQPEETVETQ
jgi:segregation and condensation protein B